jgi:hypothetical protein
MTQYCRIYLKFEGYEGWGQLTSVEWFLDYSDWRLGFARLVLTEIERRGYVNGRVHHLMFLFRSAIITGDDHFVSPIRHTSVLGMQVRMLTENVLDSVPALTGYRVRLVVLAQAVERFVHERSAFFISSEMYPQLGKRSHELLHFLGWHVVELLPT